MNKYFLLLFFCLLLFSCGNKKTKPLDVKISERDMALIMKDLNKAYFLVETSDVNDTIKQKIKRDYKKSICKHYGTTTEQYDKDLKVYISNEKQFKHILKLTNNVSKDFR